MSLSSSFADFSLAELFQLIDLGRKSGCLTVCTLPDIHVANSKAYYYYIWFCRGRLIAATHRLNGQDLVGKIHQRGWMETQLMEDFLTNQFIPDTPLGLQLKVEGLLNAEQLNLLFASQLYQIKELFEIQKGVFKLDCKASLPWREMTGLNLQAREVALMALRILKNWATFAESLPEKQSRILGIHQNHPQIRLNPLEWQLWEFANGSMNLNDIATHIQQPITVVQQAAFRLIIAGLVEEIPPNSFPLEDYPLNVDVRKFSDSALSHQSAVGAKIKISNLYLQNLVGFLKSN
ncbi:DUF4388 domain-containing protein [Calothrix sp. 336/3]|uniref:DUF4388 domain-containing protein n=1 Tax=Calothrix sp. 336/3 TaxID=1337936 RepID=UPI0004E364F0|nr:DUF4388 domain-containing protein [Calothrix sp. 336/3]AKG22895.1 hypothetical protein IJ00_17885 [Calothrix sp. 336/3]